MSESAHLLALAATIAAMNGAVALLFRRWVNDLDESVAVALVALPAPVLTIPAGLFWLVSLPGVPSLGDALAMFGSALLLHALIAAGFSVLVSLVVVRWMRR